MVKVEVLLRSYPHIPENIQKLNAELNEIISGKNNTYNTLQAAKLSDMPKGERLSNPTYQAVEDIITRFESRIEKIRDDIIYWMDLKESIDKALVALELEEYRVIDLRYFKVYKWERIPHIINYSMRNTYNIHEKAINKISAELNNGQKKGA